MRLWQVLSHCPRQVFVGGFTVLGCTLLLFSIHAQNHHTPGTEKLKTTNSGGFLTMPQSPHRVAGTHSDNQILMPRMAREEFDRIPWSGKVQVLRRHDGIRLYHNHTVYSENGVSKTSFTKLEFIPRPEHMLVPRGFTVDFTVPVTEVIYYLEHPPDQNPYKNTRKYTWAWRANPGCAVNIR